MKVLSGTAFSVTRSTCPASTKNCSCLFLLEEQTDTNNLENRLKVEHFPLFMQMHWLTSCKHEYDLENRFKFSIILRI